MMARTHLQRRAFATVVAKEVSRFLRIWQQTLLPSAVTMSLYFMIFGHVIGQRLGMVHHTSYTQYIAPGLMLLAVITNSYANVASSFYTEKYMRSIEELLMSPMRHLWVVLGFVCGGVIRGLLVGAIVFGVARAFAPLHVHEWGWMFGTLTLVAGLFAFAGFINAIFARRFDDINFIPNFVLTPLIYLGGVFYSLDQLSPFWQQVSLFNPLVYMVGCFRHFMLQTPYPAAHQVFWALLAANALLCAIAKGLLSRRLGQL